MIAALRGGVGLFTRLPVGKVEASPGATLLTGPLVGCLVAVLAFLPAAAMLATGAPGAPWIAATVALTATAYLTRGLHLDGLADFVDGLGSRSPHPVEVMQRSDIGAFGVVALIMVILLQAGLLGSLAAARGWSGLLAGLLVGLAAGRTAVIWPCRSGVPAAPSSRLGSWVAGSVPVWAALTVTAAVCAAAWLPGSWAGPAAVATACVAALVVERIARQRFGGITGDVLGACVEVGQTAALLVLLLGTA